MAASSFKEWLAEQHKKLPSEQDQQQKKEEWLNALESLYVQLHAWLRQDDPQEIVKTWTSSETIEEEDLGVYSAPLLHFVLNHRMVTAKPVARNVIGPARGGGPAGPIHPVRGEGLVDLQGSARTVHLYRVRDVENKHRWVIVDQDQLTFKDLDKATFEDALQRLFS
ncbi:MAG: hypothetical protein L0215_13785 [Gemmataceae bacterium]|nr:hypothetical protein [Gemmataceae bacterium]